MVYSSFDPRDSQSRKVRLSTYFPFSAKPLKWFFQRLPFPHKCLLPHPHLSLSKCLCFLHHRIKKKKKVTRPEYFNLFSSMIHVFPSKSRLNISHPIYGKKSPLIKTIPSTSVFSDIFFPQLSILSSIFITPFPPCINVVVLYPQT